MPFGVRYLTGVDYSSGRPSPASLKKAGIDFVIRYIGTPQNPKNLIPGEARDMQAAGIPIALVFETVERRMMEGKNAGVKDATRSLMDAKYCGIDPRAIYFACDYDVDNLEFPVVDGYLRGCADILGADRVGVYGSYNLIEHCYAECTAKWFWQTMAWSGRQISSHAHLFQQTRLVYIDDVRCDVNEAFQPDFGQTGYDMPLNSDDKNWIVDELDNFAKDPNKAYSLNTVSRHVDYNTTQLNSALDKLDTLISLLQKKNA